MEYFDHNYLGGNNLGLRQEYFVTIEVIDKSLVQYVNPPLTDPLDPTIVQVKPFDREPFYLFTYNMSGNNTTSTLGGMGPCLPFTLTIRVSMSSLPPLSLAGSIPPFTPLTYS